MKADRYGKWRNCLDDGIGMESRDNRIRRTNRWKGLNVREGRHEKSKHIGLDGPEIRTKALDHSLVRLVVHSHCSLVRLLRTARFACSALLASLAQHCFARALHCAHHLARPLTLSLLSSWEIVLWKVEQWSFKKIFERMKGSGDFTYLSIGWF